MSINVYIIILYTVTFSHQHYRTKLKKKLCDVTKNTRETLVTMTMSL